MGGNTDQIVQLLDSTVRSPGHHFAYVFCMAFILEVLNACLKSE